jgi:hypothetical protein
LLRHHIGADAAAWGQKAASLLAVQSGLTELLAAGAEAEWAAFAKAPSAAGARKVAIAYSEACDDVAQVGAMVELLEATVISSELYTNAALKKELAAVFPSEAAQAAAYATWWPVSGDAATVSHSATV